MMRTRKLFFVFALLGMLFTSATISARKELGIFNTMSVGVGVGTVGVDVEVATSITPYLALRGGLSVMPNVSFNKEFGADYNVNGQSYSSGFIEAEMGIKRTSGQLLLNVYPFPRLSSFFVAAGAYFGGSSLINVKGRLDYLPEGGYNPEVIVGDYKLPLGENGDLSGGIKASGFRPYVGLGFGRAVPKRLLSVMFELGVQFHGHLSAYSDYGNVSDAFDSNNFDEGDIITKLMDKLTVYPAMKIRLCGRLF